MPDLVDRLDDLQRRRPVLGFPLAVVYKFFDDQGNYLAAIVTYYAFIAIFPLLLIASSILGFLLQGNDALQQEILTSALMQFPIVGTQLGLPGGLQGSTSAVVIGSVAALYGVLGLGQATQNAVNVAWAVPRNSRLNPFTSRLRSFLLVITAGLAVLGVTALSSAASHLEVFSSEVDAGVKWLATVASAALTAVVLSLMMNLATSERRKLREVLPGGITVALMWLLLQMLGGVYVGSVVNRVSAMNGIFALVLGLLTLIYLASVIAMLGVEINVVLAKRLYPRALLTPFIDGVVLTEADKRVYTDYAKAQRHKGFERVTVSFAEDDGGDEKI